jgi:serine/threonine protein kinase
MQAADWWAVGVLIFEMITGRTPFHDRNRKNIQQNIINQALKCPKWMSPTVQHLLKG